MKLFKILFFLTAIMILSIATSSSPPNIAKPLITTNYKDAKTDTSTRSYDVHQYENEQASMPLGGGNRFLKPNLRAKMTCNNYPRICQVKGSLGPDCCKHRCVDVMADRSNCGMCGKKCKYYEICCNGMCVDTMWDKKHCGGCNNKCKTGSSCGHGMCSYA